MSDDRSSRSRRDGGDRNRSSGDRSGRSGGQRNGSSRSDSGRGGNSGRGGGSGRGRDAGRGGGSSRGDDRRDDRDRSGRGRSGPSSGQRSRDGGSRSGGGRSGGSDRRGGPADGRRRRRPDGRPGDGRRGGRPDQRRDDRPLTEAERRAAEVRARRGPRPPRDDRPREPESRELEQWIDEGSVREAAIGAADRASDRSQGGDRPRREPRPLDPDIGAELVDALGGQRGARLSERLAQASEALDRERFDEARRISSSIAKEAPSVAAVQEVLGLSSYRLGRYKPALKALLTAQDLKADPALLPVVMDSYRALQRWEGVDRTWERLKAASPAHEVMAEGRIVMAGALADRGRLEEAIEVMDPGRKRPKRVRDHHLREWYVLGDLYDRLGDAIKARSWFSSVAEHDPELADVTDRLRSLGR